MKTRADHVDFIRRNGPEVAALAWERYEEKGRGMVCVIADEHNEVLGTVPYDFLPATDAPKIVQPWGDRGSRGWWRATTRRRSWSSASSGRVRAGAPRSTATGSDRAPLPERA
jgi:hypothetical protein